MHEILLALAASPHLMPLALGDVTSDRLDIRVIRGRRPGILDDALNNPALAGGEASLASHLYRIAAGDRSLVGLPVFVQRAFVARYLYRRRDDRRPLLSEARCGPLRVGLYSWGATGTVWLRDLIRWLGVPGWAVQWTVGPVEAGDAPPAVQLHPRAARDRRDLTSLLLAGEIDIMFSAETPAAFRGADGDVVRVFDDCREIDRRYLRATGVFPPQHLVVLRRACWQETPWIAEEIGRQIRESNELFRANQAHNPFSTPWEALDAEEAGALIDPAIDAPGTPAFQKTIQRFVATALENGLIHRHMGYDELFAEALEVSSS